MRGCGKAMTLLALAAAAPGAASSQAVHVAPDHPGWELTGAVEAGTVLGRPALRFGGGRAALQGVDFRDGTIEFDLAMDRRRQFLGIEFRAREGRDSEDIYFRPHKSGLPDALQYTPRFHGVGPWQIYHDETATAAVEFPVDAWVPVRIEVRGRQAAVFVGDASEPRLIVPELAWAPGTGGIEFWSLLAEPDAGEYQAAISRLVVHPDVVSYAFGEPPPPEAVPGLIRRWAVSKPFDAGSGDVVELPRAILAPDGWRTVEAEPFGVVVLDRHVELLEGTRRTAVLARVVLRSDRAQTVALDLGFSDDVSAFLDGRLLFSARNDYSPNLPRREGLLTADQATLYLPLQAGENELLLSVTERFGGWGLRARLRDAQGVEVAAPLPAAGQRGTW